LKSKYSVKDDEFITVNNVKIHYKDEGNGPVLILLHGICSSLYTWDGWVNELKGQYRIIRIDLPGWGLTGPIGNDSTDLDKMIKLMAALVEKLRIDSFYLAGSSLGGYFSWNYALRYPEQVKKMILIDTVSYPQDPPWFISIAKYRLLSFLPRYIMPKFLITMNVRDVYGDKEKITPQLYDLYFDMAMREGNKSAYMDSFRFMAEESGKDELSKGIDRIKVPVLLMYGEKDRWVPPEHSKLWKRDLPSVECIIYNGIGHVPMEEAPQATARDAAAFFGKS
jgi:pimeloyl-ACP methyl ester carboxylesterase